MPLPRSVREAIDRYEEKPGTTMEGYLLRGAERVPHTADATPTRPRTLFEKLPEVDATGMYGVPVTDLAEWMGHRSTEEMYRPAGGGGGAEHCDGGIAVMGQEWGGQQAASSELGVDAGHGGAVRGRGRWWRHL
ncbi:hypothetical protein [Streptomyces sp. bgisy027]|uniref:hypothetical protein n=1 Tax=Streptomyces sp. bgisy027 TaxID=3413770 RepID=UPI003D7653EE